MNPPQATVRRPGFMKRLAMAASALLGPFHVVAVLAYFILRFQGRGDVWFIDATSFVLPWMLLTAVLFIPGAAWRRSPPLLILISIPLAIFVLLYGRLFIPNRPKANSDESITVMTYNVWGERVHRGSLDASLRRFEPDIVGLQEVPDDLARHLEGRWAERFPYQIIERGKGLLSRHPIRHYEALELGDEEAPVLAQYVELDVRGQIIGVINVHTHTPVLIGTHPAGLPIGVPTDLVDRWRDWEVRELTQAIEGIGGPLIVLGDFNLTDQQLVYASISESLRDVHREVGWGMGFTRTPFPGSGIAMWRIDYVFHSPDLVAVESQFGEFGGSDHRPLIAQLAFR